ncbi:MAG: RNA-binding protein [Deltaproteobacteria bacterium]|nr:RNA-binding protein [Deltaproteobacteria bacterium]MBW2086376.1 RNA-binding protein [Deltaproteobacteria bacterium]
MNLYVGNLSYNTSEADLTELFAQYGEVLSAKIITDRYSGQSKGFGFVEMSSRSEGEEAIAGLNGQEVNHRQIKVNEARPRSDNRRGGFGGRRGGGRY